MDNQEGQYHLYRTCDNYTLPYAREIPVIAISRGLCRVKKHKLYASKGIGGNATAVQAQTYWNRWALRRNGPHDQRDWSHLPPLRQEPSKLSRAWMLKRWWSQTQWQWKCFSSSQRISYHDAFRNEPKAGEKQDSRPEGQHHLYEEAANRGHEKWIPYGLIAPMFTETSGIQVSGH